MRMYRVVCTSFCLQVFGSRALRWSINGGGPSLSIASGTSAADYERSFSRLVDREQLYLNLDRAMAQYQDARICIVVVRFSLKEFSMERLGLGDMTILGHEVWVLVPANAVDIEEQLRLSKFQPL
jgi:hypothetical protein